jgi:hypothetical protein
MGTDERRPTTAPGAAGAAHRASVELSEPVPAEVAIGAEIVLKVKARCACACDLRGSLVHVMDSDAVVASRPLTVHRLTDAFSETDEFVVTVPDAPGEHLWSIQFAPQASGDLVHEACAVPLSFRTKPHNASVSVWGLDGPVVTGAGFTLAAGVKSSAACNLKGAAVEVHDETGAVRGRGTLGETPWPGTAALFWTDVDLTAPATAGVATWSVEFTGSGVGVPHGAASAAFSFATVKPGEHEVTVRVVDKHTGAPIERALVRAGAVRASTDGSGLAKARVSKGICEVIAWKSGYLPPSATVEVTGDLILELDAEAISEASSWALPV